VRHLGLAPSQDRGESHWTAPRRPLEQNWRDEREDINMKHIVCAASCLVVLAACTQAKAPPAPPALKAPTPVKELMAHVVDPSADKFWEASGTVVTAKEVIDRTPKTQAGWDEAVNAAATIQESGNLLLLPGRAINEPQWTQYANDLTAAGAAAVKAAQAKDGKAVFDTGGRIYEVCLECHKKYLLGY
jgi:hypothetical protein